jgi:glutamine amidotransferase
MPVILADYGAGNLFSMTRALVRAGARVRIEPDPERWLSGEALVLPGVGAFAPAAARMAPVRERLRDAVAAGFPLLGVCLGFQLLFESSDEGPGAGLGVFPGRVRRIVAPRVPHMGWTRVEAIASDPVVGPGPSYAWFAHSYAASEAPDGAVARATPAPGATFVCAARRGATWGVQFHPETSGAEGQRLLERFLNVARSAARGGAA